MTHSIVKINRHTKVANTSALERMAALKALREQIFLDHQTTYGFTDFADDIPQVNPFGHLVADIAPSLALFPRQQDKRREFIEETKRRVQAQRDAEEGSLGKDMAVSGGKMLLGSLPLLTAFALAPRAWKLRPNNLAKIKQFLLSRKTRQDFKQHVLPAAGFSGVMGAAIPYGIHSVKPSDESLNQAGEILEEHPYASSLPFADYVYADRFHKPQNYTGAAITGAGVGGLTTAGLVGIKNMISKGTSMVTRTPYKGIPMGRASLGGLLAGGGVGLLATALQGSPNAASANNNQARLGTP